MATGHGVATVDFGSTPIAEKLAVTVTNAAISVGDSIECWVNAGDSHADNDVYNHQQAAVSFRFAPSLGLAGSFTVDIYLLIGLCNGNFKIRYAYAT